MAEPRALPPGAALSGCYLLIVVGDPNSTEHRDVILQKISKGFLSWDIEATGCCISAELQYLVDQAPIPEEAKNGEKLIQFVSENLVTEVLINPQTNTLQQCIKNLLSSYTKHKHIIHSGYAFAGNGSWILQDSTFSFADFIDSFQDAEVQRIFKAYENCISIHVHCAPEGEWNTARLNRESWSKLAKVVINPNDKCSNLHGINNFVNFLGRHIVARPLEEILEPSDVVGNIRFSRPTLYIFPGGQGDSALFGVNGFNMLIDGGFNRKACFWDFARHLDRVDALLVTRVSNSNMNGVSSFLKRKVMGQVYPKIGHVFCNILDRKHSPDGDKDTDSLLVSLAEEGHLMMENLRHIGLKPQNCYSGTNAEPLNLYHKVGHGKLDMYVLNPAKDSKEVKEFLQQWHSQSSALGSSRLGMKVGDKELSFPVPNLMSICAILVWQPADPTDSITRILFPGSSPQSKIFKGLEKLQNLEILKSPVCSEKSLQSNTKIRSRMQMSDIKPIRLNSARISAVKADEKALEQVAKPVPKTDKKHDQRATPKAEEKKQHGEPKNIMSKLDEKKIEAAKPTPKTEAKKAEARKQASSAERKAEPKKVQVIGGKVIETSKILNGSGKPQGPSTSKPSSAAAAAAEPAHKFTPKAKGLKEATNKKAVEEKNIAMKKEATKKEAIKKDATKRKQIAKPSTDDGARSTKFSIKTSSSATAGPTLSTDTENRSTASIVEPSIENKNEIQQQQQPQSSFEVTSPSEEMGEADAHLAMDSAEEEKASVEEKQSLDEEVQAEKDIFKKQDLGAPLVTVTTEDNTLLSSGPRENNLTSLSPSELHTTEGQDKIAPSDDNQRQVEKERERETAATPKALEDVFNEKTTKRGEKLDDETIKPPEIATGLESTAVDSEKDHSINTSDVVKEKTIPRDKESIRDEDDVLDVSPKKIDSDPTKETANDIEQQLKVEEDVTDMPHTSIPAETKEPTDTTVKDLEEKKKTADESRVNILEVEEKVIMPASAAVQEALVPSKDVSEVVSDINKLPTYEQSMMGHSGRFETDNLKSRLEESVINEIAPAEVEKPPPAATTTVIQESQETTKQTVADDKATHDVPREILHEDTETMLGAKLIKDKPLEASKASEEPTAVTATTQHEEEKVADKLSGKKSETKEDRVIEQFSETEKHEESKYIEPSVQTETDDRQSEKAKVHAEEVTTLLPAAAKETPDNQTMPTASIKPTSTENVAKVDEKKQVEHDSSPIVHSTTQPHDEKEKMETTKPEETTPITSAKGHDEKMPPSSPVDKLLDHGRQTIADEHGPKLAVEKDFKTGIILSPIPEDAPKHGKIRDAETDQPVPTVLQQQPIHSQEFLRTPDEVADLPIHEEVPSEYEGYYHIRGPLHGIPETLAEHEDQLADIKGLRMTQPIRGAAGRSAELDDIKIEDDILVSTLKADHAEIVTLSNGTSPSTPLSPKSPKDKDAHKDFDEKDPIRDKSIQARDTEEVYDTTTVVEHSSTFATPTPPPMATGIKASEADEHRSKDHQKDKETKDDENILQQLEDTTSKLENTQKMVKEEEEEMKLREIDERKDDTIQGPKEKITVSKSKQEDTMDEAKGTLLESSDMREDEKLAESKVRQQDIAHEKLGKVSEPMARQDDKPLEQKVPVSKDSEQGIDQEVREKFTEPKDRQEEDVVHETDEKTEEKKDKQKDIAQEAKEKTVESKDKQSDSIVAKEKIVESKDVAKEKIVESKDVAKEKITESINIQAGIISEKQKMVPESVDRTDGTLHEKKEQAMESKDVHDDIIHEAKEKIAASNDKLENTASEKQDKIPESSTCQEKKEQEPQSHKDKQEDIKAKISETMERQQEETLETTETVFEASEKPEKHSSVLQEKVWASSEELQNGNTVVKAAKIPDETCDRPEKTTHVELFGSTSLPTDSTPSRDSGVKPEEKMPIQERKQEEPQSTPDGKTSSQQQQESGTTKVQETPYVEKTFIKESMKVQEEPRIEKSEAKDTVVTKVAPYEDKHSDDHSTDSHGQKIEIKAEEHRDVSAKKDEIKLSHEHSSVDSKQPQTTAADIAGKHSAQTEDDHRPTQLTTSDSVIKEAHVCAVDTTDVHQTVECSKSDEIISKEEQLLDTSLLIDKLKMSKPIDPMAQSFYDETTATAEEPLETIDEMMMTMTDRTYSYSQRDDKTTSDDDNAELHFVVARQLVDEKQPVHELHDAKAVDDFASTQMTAKHDDSHRSSAYSTPPDIIDVEKKASSSTRPLEIGAGTATSSATFTTQSFEPISNLEEKPLLSDIHRDAFHPAESHAESIVTDSSTISAEKPRGHGAGEKEYDGYYEVHDPEIFGFVKPPDDVGKIQKDAGIKQQEEILAPRAGLDILPEAERSHSAQSNVSTESAKAAAAVEPSFGHQTQDILKEVTTLSEKELIHRDEKDKEDPHPRTAEWHPKDDGSVMTTSYYDPSTVIVEECAHADDATIYGGRDRSETFIGEQFDVRNKAEIPDNLEHHHHHQGHSVYEASKVHSEPHADSAHYVDESDINEYPPAYYQHHVEHYDDPYQQSAFPGDVVYGRDLPDHGRVLPDVMQSPIHSGSYVSADDDTEDDYRGRHYEDKHSDADSESPYHRPADRSSLRAHVLHDKMAYQPPVGAESTSDDSDLDTPHQHYSRPERYYDIGEQQQQQQQHQHNYEHQTGSRHPDNCDKFGGGQGGNWDFDSSYEIPTLAEQQEHSPTASSTEEAFPESHPQLDRAYYHPAEEGERWSPSHDYPRQQQHFTSSTHGRSIPDNDHESPYRIKHSSSDSDQDCSSGLSPKGFEMDSPEVRHIPFQFNKNRHDGNHHREEPDSTYPRSSGASLSSPSSHGDKSTQDDKKGKPASKNPFDDWGEPMGLPSPTPPPDDNDKSKAKRLGGNINGGQSSEPKKQQMVSSYKNNSTVTKANGKADEKDMRKDTENMKECTKSSDKSGKKAPPTASPKRLPPSAGIKSSPIKTKRPESPLLTSDSRRAASSNRYGTQQVPQPIYVDLTYVPHHGNPFYSDVEFFRTVRARYYVFSGTNPSKEVFKALLEAKQSWEDPDLEVTVIPTYDTDTMGYWFALHEDELAKHKIDLAPSAIRCTINLQDHETSCSAYRLEF